MSNIVVKESKELEMVSREKLTEYLKSFGLAGELSPQEAGQFIEVAQAFNLNPFKREIYCIPYGSGDNRKLSILTGFEVYLKRAERTGLLDGWKAWTEGTITPRQTTKKIKKRDGGTWEKEITVWDGDLKAVVEIWRKDRTRPFTHEVLFSEYCQDNEMWAGKPQTMIKKVCIGQAFRLAFPDELAGMPYTPDELPDEMTAAPRNVTPEAPKATAAPSINAQPATIAPSPKTDPADAIGVDVEAYKKRRAEIIAQVSQIVGAKDAPGSWTEEEKELIGTKALIKEASDKIDTTPLEVLAYRAMIGGTMKHTGKFIEVVNLAIEAGDDLVKLAKLLGDCHEVIAKLEAKAAEQAEPAKAEPVHAPAINDAALDIY